MQIYPKCNCFSLVGRLIMIIHPLYSVFNKLHLDTTKEMKTNITSYRNSDSVEAR